MCQSRAEGGIRCASHTKIALQNSEDALVDIVIAESLKETVKLPDKESKFVPSIDGYELEDRLMANPLYKNAKFEKEIAETSDLNFRNRVTDVIAEGDNTALKDVLYRGNPEVRRLIGERAIIMDAAEQRAKKASALKRPFIIAEGKKKAEWATESLKFIRSSINDEVKLHTRVQKLSGSSVIASSPDVFESVYKSQEHVRSYREVFNHHNASLTKTYKAQIINENMRKDPQYQAALASSAVTSSEAYTKWQAKHDDIKHDYAMTNENMDMLRNQARIAGENTPQGKAYLLQVRELEKDRAKKIAENRILAAKDAYAQEMREKEMDDWEKKNIFN
jgi:hypothetical protein